MKNRVLAFSSSRVGNSGYLESAVPVIQEFLGDKPLHIGFIPFASVGSYSDYLQMVSSAFVDMPYTISLVEDEDPAAVIEACDVIMVGGGNTFKLLHHLYKYDLVELIKRKVEAGTPYIGWSAGSNLAGPTICTTNDMPIIEPASFQSFSFFSFQVNPHYYNLVIEGHNGETRDQRLTEFLKLNPSIPIIGLPEGTALLADDGQVKLIGTQPAIFLRNIAQGEISRKEIVPGSDILLLLQ
jgi:dipeptidase E